MTIVSIFLSVKEGKKLCSGEKIKIKYIDNTHKSAATLIKEVSYTNQSCTVQTTILKVGSLTVLDVKGTHYIAIKISQKLSKNG